MQVQTFEEACQLRGYDANTVLPEVSNYPVNHQKAMIAFAKLVIINEAMNEGKKFDWNDYDQNKYYPWFDLEKDKQHNPSGFRFNGTCYVLTITFTLGGSRLCFHSRSDAEFAGKHFEELYREILVISE